MDGGIFRCYEVNDNVLEGAALLLEDEQQRNTAEHAGLMTSLRDMVLFLIAPNFTPCRVSAIVLLCALLPLDEKVSHPNSRDWSPRIASAPNDATRVARTALR
jgi:hypothetical protein